MTKFEGRLALSLSGGGFRATLFHLGVLRCLADHDLLNKLDLVTSVSGGSVLAAHLAVNWERYTGSKEGFDEAAKEIEKFTRADVRGRIVRRWLCGTLLIFPRLFGLLRFGTLLVRSYSRLYKNSRLKSLRGSEKHPEFHILATSLTTGELCKFTHEGFFYRDRDAERRVRTESLPLAVAVAASSAFPPLFPPIPVTRRILNCDVREFDKTQYLTDGGIFDNLGLQELARLNEARRDKCLSLLVSDAGGNFDWTVGNRYTRFVGRNIRATDILMDRVSKLVPSVILGNSTTSVCHIYIGRELSNQEEPEAEAPEIQRSVRNIRTDLDSFSGEEARALAKHGYAEASFALRNCGLVPADKVAESSLVKETPSARSLRIRSAGRRRLRLFTMGDIASWILLLLVIGWGASIAWLPVYYYRQAHATRDALSFSAFEYSGHVTDATGGYIESTVYVDLDLDSETEAAVKRGIEWHYKCETTGPGTFRVMIPGIFYGKKAYVTVVLKDGSFTNYHVNLWRDLWSEPDFRVRRSAE